MNTNSFIAMVQRRKVLLGTVFVLALIALPFILTKYKTTYIATSHVLLVGKDADAMIPSGDMSTLTTSTTVMERIVQRFGLAVPPDELRLRVDAKVGLRSNVMPISFRDHDRKLARDVTNALAEETVRYYKQLSGGQFDQMIGFLQRSLDGDRAKIRAIDEQLQNAAQHDTYVGSDRALETITARIGDLQTQRAAAYAAMVSDEAIAAAQSAQPAEIADIVKHEVISADPYLQALRAGQARDAAQLDFQRAQFTDRYPGLPSMQEQVKLEDARLSAAERQALSGSPSSSTSYAATVLAKRNALAVAAGDRAKVGAIDAQIAAEEAHLKDLPGTGSTVNLLRIERDGATSAYAANILKLNETKANQAAAASLGSLVVVDEADQASPRIPRIAVDIILAFLLLALTLSVGLIVDVLDPSLRSPESIERLYGLPLIGKIGRR